MKQLLDFIPLVLFFIFFKLYDIYTGVWVLIIASTIALAITWLIYRKIEKIILFTYFMVVFFGSLTLYFNNDLFFKWKVTVVYAVLALVLLFSQFILKKILIKSMLGKEIDLPNHVWSRLNLAWIGFFIFCGTLNIYVMFWLSQEAWVNFKAFGLIGLTLLFTLFNGVYIYKYTSKEQGES